MNLIDIRFTLDSAASQPQIIELLKTNGIDCIQTSSGLCAKSLEPIGKIEELLKSKDLSSGVTLSEVDQSGELSKDVKALIES